MKKEIRTLIKNFVGVILAIAIVVAGVFYLGKVFSPEEMDLAVAAIDSFHKLPENSLEAIVFGSSRAWRGVDVMEMYRNYGVGAYNYACNWQHINTTAMYVTDAFLTQNPKVVLIETGRVNLFLEDTNPDGEIYYSRPLENTLKKEEFLRDCFKGSKERYFAFYVPLGMFHSEWENLTKHNFDLSRLKGSTESMGMCVNEDNIETQIANSCKVTIPNWHEFWQDSLPDKSVDELDYIVNLCNSRGAKVILFNIPYEGDEYFYHDALTEYANEHDCEYIDFFDLIEETGLDGNTDFSDREHLNASGAQKIGDYLGRYISENYDVTDFRTVPNNQWER